ncbi:MAG: ABC transporter permease [Chloroflexia bacterium]
MAATETVVQPQAPGAPAPTFTVPLKKRIPYWVKALMRNPVSVVGTVIVILFILVALFAPVLAPPTDPANPYNMPRVSFYAEPQLPGPGLPFGTTPGGYDLFYGVVWGTRTAFQVGLIVTAITVVIGGLVGAVSAYVGGWFDEIVQRIVEIVLAFPFLMAALTLAVVLVPKLGNPFLSAVLAVIAFSWPSYARLIRGDVLSVKQRDYVLAAKVIGAPPWRILFRHILPNAIYSLLVVASLDIGTYVLFFSALSFLGLGAPEGYADWGQLLSFARNWIPDLARYWHIVVFPGAALVLFVLGFNLIGDAFRDAVDPKMRGK